MTTVITGKDNIAMFRLIQLKHALHLEVKGLKHSRGSVYALVKREFGLRGNKRSVYTQFCELVEREKQHHPTPKDAEDAVMMLGEA